MVSKSHSIFVSRTRLIALGVLGPVSLPKRWRPGRVDALQNSAQFSIALND